MKSYLTVTLAIYLVLIFFACKQIPENIIDKTSPKLDSLTNIWELSPETGGIKTSLPNHHTDQLEFSGLQVSGIITYGSDKNGELVLSKKIVWPMLRTIPNDTHASLIHDFETSMNSKIIVDGEKISAEKPFQVHFNGILTINSATNLGIEIKRIISPCVDKPAIVELITLTNKSNKDVDLRIENLDYTYQTQKNKGVYGSYSISCKSSGAVGQILKKGAELSFSQVYQATKQNLDISINVLDEIQKRKDFINSLNNSLVLETPDANLNQMFGFAKLRAAESIFDTKGGLMHGPGGGRYYAAIWANDQAEYVNPFFPFLGNGNGNESAVNSFRHFARFMNSENKPIPSSIVAEGDTIWDGAGDRGDAAMIAYGASRFALAYGDKNTADSLLPLIKWCLKYCEMKMLPEGVIASDCDELENRFPAGKANLTTNMLAYGGYLSASNLLYAMGIESDLALEYEKKAFNLRNACEKYFGHTVQGFDTYQYYKGNDKLRSWICIPLTMGVYDRKDETLKALLSNKLWNKNGIFTESGDSTFWDRATLYAFRGIIKAGKVDLGMKYLSYYTQKRLLGEHVPYAVEAYPEGNQRHLSAESGLYCRVITEGLFGMEPIGFNSFKCSPRLPLGWNFMKLKNIKAFKNNFDIEVYRQGNKTKVVVVVNGKPVKETVWDGKSEIKISL